MVQKAQNQQNNIALEFHNVSVYQKPAHTGIIKQLENQSVLGRTGKYFQLGYFKENVLRKRMISLIDPGSIIVNGFSGSGARKQVIFPSLENLPNECKCTVIYGEIGQEKDKLQGQDPVSLNWFDEDGVNFNFWIPRFYRKIFKKEKNI